MGYIELEVLDVESSQMPSEAFGLIVRGIKSGKEMTIVIGLQEARTLILLLNKIQTRRPGTHELFKNFIQHAGYQLSSVIIYEYDEGVFYANLLLKNETDTIELDSRTSDAIAIALLMETPIFIRKDIFERLSVEPRKEKKTQDLQPEIDLQPEELERYVENKLQEMPDDELQRLLQGAIGSEDFELAAKIQEEINARSSNKD
jgi:bifunctional DNase/RNase